MKNLLILCGSFLLYTPLFSATYTVLNTNDDGAGSLRDAVFQASITAGQDTIVFDAATDGDTIVLTTGEISIDHPVVILGNGYGTTFISADSSRILNVAINASPSEFWDFQLLNGFVENQSGGAVNILSASVEFIRIKFRNNEVASQVRDGGAVSIGTLNLDTTLSSFSECIFQDNLAGSGGAIHVNGSSRSIEVNFDRCTFDGNSAVFNGGAIYNFGQNDLVVSSINECVFLQNYAGQGGGAIYNNGNFDGSASPLIINSKFKGNESGNNAGAIFNAGSAGGESSPTIINSIFTGNKSNFRASAIYNAGGPGASESNTKIINCTFLGNVSEIEKGAIYVAGFIDNAASINIYNTLIWNNGGGVTGVFFDSDIQSSLIQGLDSDDDDNLNSQIMEITPEIVSFPDTSNLPDTSGDSRLRICSPLINAGNASLIPEYINTDCFGQSRVAYFHADIGAYEFPDPIPADPLLSNNCDGCVFNLNLLPGTYTGSLISHYQIQTIGEVTTEGDLMLKSREIILGPGFSTEVGDVFETITEFCDLGACIDEP